MLARRR